VSVDPRALAAVLAAVRHYECGDCWYSCPESDEGCCNDADEGCTCWAPLCHEAAAMLRDLAAERDALVAANQLWQSNVEGAIADTGNLPGDLTAWSAIRRLTDERDYAKRGHQPRIHVQNPPPPDDQDGGEAEVVMMESLVSRIAVLAAENERLRRGMLWEPVVSDRIPVEFVAELSDKFVCRYDIEALDRSLADCGFRIIADAVDGPT
jgi:hypothetical protein